MSDYPPTAKSRLKRLPKRGSYDTLVIYPILDTALICSIAFVQEEQPYVIPTLFARDHDSIIIHGASTSRLIRHLQKNHAICLSVAILDGLVMARSIFEHSMNYRSVVVFGQGKAIVEEDEKRQALQILSEKLMAGRWQDARQPNSVELKATGVVRVEIESATAKLRNAPPEDQAEDVSLSVWAGVIPISSVYGEPIPAPDLAANILFPDYLRNIINSKVNPHP